MRVALDSPAARAQLARNLAFAEDYRAIGAPPKTRPRALVTGFGRFREHRANATGRAVAALVPGLDYPFTDNPPNGTVDDPAPQIARGDVALARVDLRAVVLPVHWDTAAFVVARELEAFAPDVVLMTGISARTDRALLETSASNLARPEPDASRHLAPLTGRLIDDAPEAIALPFPGEVVRGVDVSGFAPALEPIAARPDNAYVCNALAFQTSWLLAGHPLALFDDRLTITLGGDVRRTSRAFLHVPALTDEAAIAALTVALRTVVERAVG